MTWFSSNTVQGGPDITATLVAGEKTETEGTFTTQSTIRVAHPWRSGIPAGVPMSLTIEGNAGFGTLKDGDVSALGRSLILSQRGDYSKADRAYSLVGQGTQHYTSELVNGQIDSKPTSKSAKEVTMTLHVEGQEDTSITYNLLTTEGDARVGRTRHIVVQPLMGKDGPAATLATQVDDTCMDRVGDCRDCTSSCFWGSLNVAGRVGYSIGSSIAHPRTTMSEFGRSIRGGVAYTFGLEVPAEAPVEVSKEIKAD